MEKGFLLGVIVGALIGAYGLVLLATWRGK